MVRGISMLFSLAVFPFSFQGRSNVRKENRIAILLFLFPIATLRLEPWSRRISFPLYTEVDKNDRLISNSKVSGSKFSYIIVDKTGMKFPSA